MVDWHEFTQPLISMIRALRSQLARLFFPYGSVRRVLRGPAAGLRFRVSPGMGAMYALGYDHAFALRTITGFLRCGEVVYDIGANQGQFVLPLARRVGRKGLVLAVEPLKANQAALTANLALGEFPQTLLVRAAVSAGGGRKAFVFDPERNTMGTFVESSVKLDSAMPFQMVNSLTLDQLMLECGRRPQCIKIDVEGSADEVLGGAGETIRLARPAMLVELHLSRRHDRERKALIEVARKWGYSITMFDGLPIEADRPPGEYQSWCLPPPEFQPTAFA